MKNYYKEKADFHLKEYELAKLADKGKAADFNFTEYQNYKEMSDRVN